MTIRRELIDELFKEYETSQDILGKGGLFKELKGEQGHIEIEVPCDRQGSGLTATGEKGPNSFERFR